MSLSPKTPSQAMFTSNSVQQVLWFWKNEQKLKFKIWVTFEEEVDRYCNHQLFKHRDTSLYQVTHTPVQARMARMRCGWDRVSARRRDEVEDEGLPRRSQRCVVLTRQTPWWPRRRQWWGRISGPRRSHRCSPCRDLRNPTLRSRTVITTVIMIDFSRISFSSFFQTVSSG